MPRSKRYYDSEREGLPDAERDKQERRIVRYLKSGMPVARMHQVMGVSKKRIREIAAAHGITPSVNSPERYYW